MTCGDLRPRCESWLYLLPGLVGGRHHYRIADGESNEEIDDVGQV